MNVWSVVLLATLMLIVGWACGGISVLNQIKSDYGTEWQFELKLIRKGFYILSGKNNIKE